MRRVREAQSIGIYPYFRALSQSEGVTATIDGKDVVMLGSNNYLGLTTDPRVRQVMIEAVELYGTQRDRFAFSKRYAGVASGT